MNQIPLVRAYICQNCEVVSESAIQCPACACCTALYPLATWLGRESAPETPAGLWRAVAALEEALQ